MEFSLPKEMYLFPGATSPFCLICTSNICNCYFTKWTTKYFLENLNIIFTLT